MRAARDKLSPMARLVRRHDRDRFLTALFAPAQARESLYALYAFNYEVAKTRESVRETMLGRIRLQWWREAIAAIYGGAPVRRHEVTEPLAAAIAAHGLSRRHFEALIDAREADLDDEPPASLASLEAYAAASSGSLVLLALEAVGVRGPDAEEAGREIGIAYALAGLLRAVPFHAGARRLYLPADLIEAAGIDVERGLYSRNRSPALAGVAAQVAGRARFHLAAARASRRRMPRARRAGAAAWRARGADARALGARTI